MLLKIQEKESGVYCNLIMCGKLSLQTFFSMSYISIWPGTFTKKEVIYETAEYNNFFQKTSWRQLDSLFITIFNNKLLLIRN